MNQTNSTPTLFQMIIIAILFGILSGLVSELFYQTYFGAVQEQPNDVQINRQIISGTITSKNIGSIENNKQTQLYFVDAQKSTESVLSPDDILAAGMMLSEDGWIATAYAAHETRHQVLYENKLFPIQHTLYDASSLTTFVKIDTTKATTTTLAPKRAVLKGETGVILTPADAISILHIENDRNATQQSLLAEGISTDTYPTNIKTSPTENILIGSIVFNTQGEAIGIMQSTTTVIPSYQFSDALNTILRNKALTRPTLGIRYRQADQNLLSDTRGAIVLSNSTAGILQINDTIVEVEGVRIDKKTSLSDIIQRFEVGKNIDVKIERNNTESTVSLLLQDSPSNQALRLQD